MAGLRERVVFLAFELGGGRGGPIPHEPCDGFGAVAELGEDLRGVLSLERRGTLHAPGRALEVDRYALPAIRSLNFVLHGLLQEGVAAATRQDPQAKSLGEWLRARLADLPEELLP